MLENEKGKRIVNSREEGRNGFMQTETEYRNIKLDSLIFGWRSILRREFTLVFVLGITLFNTVSVFKGHG